MVHIRAEEEMYKNRGAGQTSFETSLVVPYRDKEGYLDCVPLFEGLPVQVHLNHLAAQGSLVHALKHLFMRPCALSLAPRLNGPDIEKSPPVTHSTPATNTPASW